MSSKNKRVPKRYCDKDYRVGQRVRANLTHRKRILEGEIIKKIRRFEGYSFEAKKCVSDLITIKTDDGIVERFDAEFVEEVIDKKVNFGRDFYSRFNLDEDFTLGVFGGEKISRNKLKFDSILGLTIYFTLMLCKENPHRYPLTDFNEAKFISMIEKNKLVGLIEYEKRKVNNLLKDSIVNVVVKKDKFKKYLRRNIFKLCFTQWEEYCLITELNVQDNKNLYNDMFDD